MTGGAYARKYITAAGRGRKESLKKSNERQFSFYFPPFWDVKRRRAQWKQTTPRIRTAPNLKLDDHCEIAAKVAHIAHRLQQMANPPIDQLHQLSTQRIVNVNVLIKRVPLVGLFQLNESLIIHLIKSHVTTELRRARQRRSRGGPALPNLTLLNINGISPLRDGCPEYSAFWVKNRTKLNP
jgi:hypothetical protein